MGCSQKVYSAFHYKILMFSEFMHCFSGSWLELHNYSGKKQVTMVGKKHLESIDLKDLVSTLESQPWSCIINSFNILCRSLMISWLLLLYHCSCLILLWLMYSYIFKNIWPNHQGFIQALLLTSLFHEGLSFMIIGHNPTWCISSLDPCSWVFIWGAVNPACGVQGKMSLEGLVISPIPSFQIAFPCIIWWPNPFLF